MTELQVTSEILTLILTMIGSLGATLPFVAKFKSKLSQAKALIISIESALEDDKITQAELKHITRYAREIVGTKKI